MDFDAVIEQRRSARSYLNMSVPSELLAEILSIAERAPSAGAIRGWQIITTNELVTRYWAPVHLIVCANPEKYAARYGKRGMELYALQDATIVAAYLQLGAVSKGLATVWVGAFNEARVKRELNLADELRPVAILPLGYST